MEEINKRMVLAALVIMLGSNTGSIINHLNPPNYRPDPFTGLMAAQMEARIMETMNSRCHGFGKELQLIEKQVVRNEVKLQECLKVLK